LDITSDTFTPLAMMDLGLAAAQPELSLKDVFTPEAAAINGVMERKCFANLSATIRYSFGENQMTMLKIRLSNALTWVRTIQHSSPAHNQSLPW
jgi:hypothetical protein